MPACIFAGLTLLATTTFTVFASGQPLEFKEFKSAEGKYKVLLPGEVKTTSKKTAAGLVTRTAAVVIAPGKSFSVNHFELTFPIPAEQAPAVLEKMNATIKGEKGTVLVDKAIEFGSDKLPGRDLLVEQPTGHVRQRSVIVGNRVFQIVALGPKEFVTSKDADRFIESFELLK